MVFKMKTTFLTLSILFLATYSFADPIEYVDDWYLLKYTEDYELKDKEADIRLSAYNQKLFLTRENETHTIYEFDNDTYEVYLISEEENKRIVYVFNDSKKKLFKAEIKIKDTVFIEIPWQFGSLKAIFKNCDDSEENFNYEIKKNNFLTKFKYSKRPKGLQCGYLISGGRCYLIYDPKTNEYEVGDKMILSADLEYKGDINSIGFTVFGGCSLYRKLTIN